MRLCGPAAKAQIFNTCNSTAFLSRLRYLRNLHPEEVHEAGNLFFPAGFIVSASDLTEEICYGSFFPQVFLDRQVMYSSEAL